MPLLYLSLAFLAGVLIASRLPLAGAVWFAAAGGSLLLAGLAQAMAALRLNRKPAWLHALARPGCNLAGPPDDGICEQDTPNRPGGPLQEAGRTIQTTLAAPLSGGRAAILRPWLAFLGLSPDAFPLSLLVALPLLALAALFLGAARYQTTRPDLGDPAFIAAHNDSGEPVTLTGLLIAPADERDAYTNLLVAVEQMRPADGILHSAVHGIVLARVEPGSDWRYGDRVVITGRLQTPPVNEEFSYRDYLARQGVHTFLPWSTAALLERSQGNAVLGAVFALRQHALHTLYRLFPDPEASLLAGILLGVETGIPPDLKDAFRDTGTAHIVAISGFNITILAALFAGLFGRLLGRRGGALAAGTAIGLYTLFVGADAAVVRAAIMGVLVILARQIKRAQAGHNTLALVAALMAFQNPLVLWDPGFQLSFAATLGLLLYAEPMTGSFRRQAVRYLRISTVDRIAGPVSEFVLLTLAAQLTTLPVVIYHFQRLSLSSFLVNPLVLPAQALVMILGGLATLTGMVAIPLGRLFGAPAWFLTAYTIRMVELFGKMTGGVLVLGRIALPVVVLLFVLLFGMTFQHRTQKMPGRQSEAAAGTRLPPVLSGTDLLLRPLRLLSRLFSSPLPLGVLLVLAALLWRLALAAPDGLLHITLLDTGGGEALLVRTPTGRHLLINGGPSTVQLSDALGRRLPFGTADLDFLVVAAAADRNLAGLPRVIERFPAAQVLWSGLPTASRSAGQLQHTLTELQIPVRQAQEGHVLALGQGARLRVLSAGKRGATLLLEWDRFRLLLPIGIDFETMESLEMGARIGPLSALLLADSGYGPLNPVEWIANLRPQLILLSVEAGNQEGLPDPATLQAAADYNLLRTDQHGWIQISTDGRDMWLQTARLSPQP